MDRSYWERIGYLYTLNNSFVLGLTIGVRSRSLLSLLVVHVYAHFWALFTPRFTIEFQDSTYFRRGSRDVVDGGVTHELLIRILNASGTSINNCEVFVDRLDDEEGSLQLLDLPAWVELVDRKQPFELRPKEFKMARLASAKQDSPSEVYIHLCELKDDEIWTRLCGVGKDPLELKLRVVSDGPALTKSFKIFLDEKRVLRLRHG